MIGTSGNPVPRDLPRAAPKSIPTAVGSKGVPLTTFRGPTEATAHPYGRQHRLQAHDDLGKRRAIGAGVTQHDRAREHLDNALGGDIIYCPRIPATPMGSFTSYFERRTSSSPSLTDYGPLSRSSCVSVTTSAPFCISVSLSMPRREFSQIRTRYSAPPPVGKQSCRSPPVWPAAAAGPAPGGNRRGNCRQFESRFPA